MARLPNKQFHEHVTYKEKRPDHRKTAGPIDADPSNAGNPALKADAQGKVRKPILLETGSPLQRSSVPSPMPPQWSQTKKPICLLGSCLSHWLRSGLVSECARAVAETFKAGQLDYTVAMKVNSALGVCQPGWISQIPNPRELKIRLPGWTRGKSDKFQNFSLGFSVLGEELPATFPHHLAPYSCYFLEKLSAVGEWEGILVFRLLAELAEIATSPAHVRDHKDHKHCQRS